MAILVDWAKQTVAGTPGTGTITLSTAVTGFIKLQDDTRLVDGGLVYYTIEDGSNFERGIGTYAATGTTLSRTLIKAKYESGTYSENPGTGLTLTSSAIVSCSAVAATHNFKGCVLYTTNDQTISTATWTDITYESERVDTDGFHSTVSNTARITIPVGVSKVRLSCCVSFTANSTGPRGIRINRNGLSAPDFETGTQLIDNNLTNLTVIDARSACVSVTSGDYFTVQAYQASGGNLTTSGSSGSYRNWFGCEVVE